MGLKLITPPIEEPVSVDYAKQYIREYSDDLNEQISGLIKSARTTAEQFQNTAYLTQVWQLSMDEFPDDWEEIPLPPLQKIDTVKYYDYYGNQTVMSVSDFEVDTSCTPAKFRLKPTKFFPSVALRDQSPFIITFTCGYTTPEQVPQDVKTAICEYVKALFDGKEIPKTFEQLLWYGRVMV